MYPRVVSRRLYQPLFSALFLVAVLVGPGRSEAQSIPIKTVPVASGDQFLLFPSSHLAMGSVSLAVSDTLGDPFGNPAAGSRISESFFFGSPTFYSVSDRNGSGRSLPVGAFFRDGDWFAGGALTLQELKGADRTRGAVVPAFVDVAPWSSWAWPLPDFQQDLSEASARNLYVFGMAGYRFPEKGLSIGVSGSYADLGAVDGVELLYAQAQEIRQSGHMSRFTLGLLKEWPEGRSLEAVLFRSSVRMDHDVTYLNLFWEPVLPDTIPQPHWETRIEENFDYTDTWGGHLAYQKPLRSEGWNLGWSLTVNRMDHPKIPNYEIQNIPRDPGDTWAFGFGVGVAKTEGPARFAADLILEPIRSDTWADAAADTVNVNGGPIKAGEKTVENEFLFTNALVRTGASFDHGLATFKAGLQVRSIAYELDQFDRIELTKRNQDESWMEWTPSLGVSLALAGLDVHWVTRFTTGTGRPGTRWSGDRMAEASGVPTFDNANFILAPSGPLTLQDARVTTHQLSVVIPMR